jgi:hypothetical protein
MEVELDILSSMDANVILSPPALGLTFLHPLSVCQEDDLGYRGQALGLMVASGRLLLACPPPRA